MPREGSFFDLFNAHTEQIVVGARGLVSLMSHLGVSDEEAEKCAREVDEAEERADRITHDTLSLLHKTFITPLDRDEILGLINGLDDTLDVIQDVVQSLTLYDVRTVTGEARQLAEISLSACERIRAVVAMLPSMEDVPSMLKTCEEVHRLESDCDRVMRTAISRLFRYEDDVRNLIKLKEVYEVMEEITDRCSDVADTIEAIILENS